MSELVGARLLKLGLGGPSSSWRCTADKAVRVGNGELDDQASGRCCCCAAFRRLLRNGNITRVVTRSHRLLTLSPRAIFISPLSVPLFTMQAIRLQKKYPEVSQDEMFDLISRFKCVRLHRGYGAIMTSAPLQHSSHRRPGARR